MKKNLLNVFTVGAVVFLLSVFALAQDNRSTAGNLYVISANAGGVNYVEGKVSVRQNNGRNGYLLKGDKLEVGEKVFTGADGKAEILLNPGSYLRLAENSAFEFTTTSLDDLQLKLTGGSAMFEVITDNDFTFAVNTPKGHFNILESGIYRVDVLGDGSGKIEVRKGKAQVGGEQAAQIVKSGRSAIVNGDQAAIEKFDRGDKDDLEVWSKSRAKELAKVNSRLDKNNMRNTLVSSFNNRGWNLYNSYGLWVFDNFSGNYCFLPFGYGWNSPYGYGYGRDLWYLRLPRYIYNQPPPPSATVRATHPNDGTTPGVRSANSTEDSRARAVPPFVRVQREIGTSPREIEDSPSVFNGSPRFPSGIRTQPSAAPTEINTNPNGSGRGKGNN